MDDLVELNVPRHKLIFAIPFFGRSYKLRDHFRSKLGDFTRGWGKPGFLTQKAGIISYGEVVSN